MIAIVQRPIPATLAGKQVEGLWKNPGRLFYFN